MRHTIRVKQINHYGQVECNIQPIMESKHPKSSENQTLDTLIWYNCNKPFSKKKLWHH